MTTQPKNLVVVGAGPIGAELGQAFQRLGTNTTFICRGDKFLPREDRDAAAQLTTQLESDGCSFAFNSTLERIEMLQAGNPAEDILPKMRLNITENGTAKSLDIDTILFATGRKPNVSNMGLEDAGVDFDETNGIYSNEKMQTANNDVYTVGDCAAAALNREEAVTVKGTGP